MSRGDQVSGKPGQEEPERRSYRKLPDVNAPELTMPEELGRLAPFKFLALPRPLSQTSPFPNVVEFGFIGPAAMSGVPIAAERDRCTDKREDDAEGKHEGPAKRREEPGEDGRANSQLGKLTCVVDPIQG